MNILIITLVLSNSHEVRKEWLPVVKAASSHYNLDWRLLDALIFAESNWNPAAESHKGAQGLTQLMPNTAKHLKVNNPYNPGEAIWGAAWYLRQLNNQFKNWRLTLGAYNAGPTRVAMCGCIPPFKETRDYVAKIGRRYGDLD